MIELKVTSSNLKTPNEIVKVLNDLLERNKLRCYARAVTNGNHLGYGLIRIADGSDGILDNLDSEEVTEITIKVIGVLRKCGNFNQIEILRISNDEDTENFIYNHLTDNAFRYEKDNYITITKIV